MPGTRGRHPGRTGIRRAAGTGGGPGGMWASREAPGVVFWKRLKKGGAASHVQDKLDEVNVSDRTALRIYQLYQQ